MKIRKMLIASLAVSLFSSVLAGVTCGGIFNWVYKLNPTNVWKSMEGPPGIGFYIGSFMLNIILVIIYALLKKGIPGKNKLVKGSIFGLCVWAVGMLPGMFATYYFMTVANGVVIYWTLMGLVETPIKGIIIAAIYGE